MAHCTLIIGGAKSGKSSFAQARAEELPGRHVFIATATADDDEMVLRVARHQAQRGSMWTTLEEPLELTGALATTDGEDAVMLVDCLTLWLSNLMTRVELDDSAVEERCAALAQTLEGLQGIVILVSNEVGMGIVPAHALSRRFRDSAGALNQRLGALCDEVYLVAAGIPLALKETRT